MSPIFRYRAANSSESELPLAETSDTPDQNAEFSPDIYTAPVGTQEYFLDAPEVLEMVNFSQRYSEVLALTKGTTVENINRGIENSPIDRRLKRALINSGVAREAGLAAQALAQLLAEPGRYPLGDTQARYRVAANALSPFNGKLPLLDEDAVYMDIYRAAVNHEPRLVDYWSKRNKLIERFDADLSTDSAARYELARLVSNYSLSSKVNPETIDLARLGWLTKLLSGPKNNSLLSIITKEIAQGEYRSLQAYELLSKGDEQRQAVQNFVHLMAHASIAEANEEVLKRLAEAYAMWPKDLVDALDDLQEDTVQAIKSARDRAQAELAAELGLASDGRSSEDRFAAAMTKMIDSVVNLPRLAVHDGVPQFARKNMSRAIQPLPKKAETPRRPAPTPEIVREIKNTIAFIDGSGRQSREDSGEYHEMVQDFINKYKGTKALPDDFQSSIEYLRNLDIRRLTPKSGVKRITSGDWGVKLDEETIARPLYEFKPQLAAGFPLKTQVMRDHRILFTLVDNDTIGIVGIVPRRDLSTFLKNAGINNSAS